MSIFLILIAYLLGSVSGSLLLGHLRGVDIRNAGSGNAGGTNAFRTQGWKFAIGVVLVDISKGALAAWLALRFGNGNAWLPWLAVLAAVIGHVWPIWHGCRGGKGAATVIGGALVLWPSAILPVVLVWIVMLISTGYVGLSTIIAGLSLPLFAWWSGADHVRMTVAIVIALLLLFTHRSNLARLRAGAESRFDKARLFHRLFK